jgi:hypothetical protein
MMRPPAAPVNEKRASPPHAAAVVAYENSHTITGPDFLFTANGTSLAPAAAGTR